MSELILRPEDHESITMTIRISRKLKDKYDELANQTGYSRNHLIATAMTYAAEHFVIEDLSRK